jgi:hypothetical protein
MKRQAVKVRGGLKAILKGLNSFLSLQILHHIIIFPLPIMKFLAVLIALPILTLANADVIDNRINSMAGSKRLVVDIPGLVNAHVLPSNIGASAGPVGASIDTSGTTTKDPEHGTIHHTWAELAAQHDSGSSFSDLEARSASDLSNAGVDARTESAQFGTTTEHSNLIAAAGSSSLDYSPSSSSTGEKTSSAGATEMEKTGAVAGAGAPGDETGRPTGVGSKDAVKAADVGTAAKINGKRAATRGIAPSKGQSDKDHIGKRLMMGNPFMPNLIPSASDIAAMAPLVDTVIKEVPSVINLIKTIMPKNNNTDSQQGQTQPQQIQSNSTDEATPSAGTNTSIPITAGTNTSITSTAGTDTRIPSTAVTNTRIPITGVKSREVAPTKGQAQEDILGKRRTIDIGIQSHQAVKRAKQHKGKGMVRKRKSAPVDPKLDVLVVTT